MRRSSLVYALLLVAMLCLLLWQWGALRSLRSMTSLTTYDTVHVEHAVPRYVTSMGDTVVRVRAVPTAPAPAPQTEDEPQPADSIEVILPVIEHIYTDDSTYNVRVRGSYISGADIEIIHRTQRVTAPARRSVRVRPCVYVGYGLTYSRGIRAGPQVGVGLSITF